MQHFLFHALYHTLKIGLSAPLHTQNIHENEIQFPRKYSSIRYFVTLKRILSGELHTLLFHGQNLRKQLYWTQCHDAAQLPRLATGRPGAAVTVTVASWHSHRMFCWYRLCGLFRGRRVRSLLRVCILFAHATIVITNDFHVRSRERQRLIYASAATQSFSNL